ncbi:hypothetical protein RHSIM_RhsimUnG0191300 [Rhododendron simsii]|uniref:Uncharacterized protein n=1 Tax=Rhododendron simsii TaxID=118357 RepID=A0A834FUB8_RHOSS|nr:hypothetical protein RHSIM_RhsimUnG0191300 [Rhododendron simsii]
MKNILVKGPVRTRLNYTQTKLKLIVRVNSKLRNLMKQPVCLPTLTFMSGVNQNSWILSPELTVILPKAFSSQSLHPSSRFLSRFNFIPGNVSFRLSRATSLGSSRQGLDYKDFGLSVLAT